MISYPVGSIFCIGSASRAKNWSKSLVFRSMSSKNGGAGTISSLCVTVVRIAIAQYKEEGVHKHCPAV